MPTMTLRRVAWSFVIALAIIVGSAAAESNSAIRPDPLQGTWQTSTVSLRAVQQVLLSSGSSQSQVKSFVKFFGVTKAWRNRLTFYREGNSPFLAVSYWDPTMHSAPGDADHGPYTLLPGRRFVARGVDPPTDRVRELFGYTVTINRLKLRLISLKEPFPAFSRQDLVRDTMLLRLVAAFPYLRTS